MSRTPTADPAVFDDPDERRYELVVDDRVAGVVEYRSTSHGLAFVHTEVDPSIGRHGLGTRLVQAALDDVRRRGLLVTPRCPFVARFLREHPDYLDLVDPAHGQADT